MKRVVRVGAVYAVVMSGSAAAAPTNEEVLAELRALRAEVGQLRQQSQRDRAELNRLRGVQPVRTRSGTVSHSPTEPVIVAAPEHLAAVPTPPSWAGGYAGASFGIGTARATTSGRSLFYFQSAGQSISAEIPNTTVTAGSFSFVNPGQPASTFTSQTINNSIAATVGRTSHNAGGLIALHAGYNVQFSPLLVAGAQLDGAISQINTVTKNFSTSGGLNSGINTSTQSALPPFFPDSVRVTGSASLVSGAANSRTPVRFNWMASALGRIGLLGGPDTLVYALGGWTIAQVEEGQLDLNIKHANGPTVGGGLETRIAPLWSAFGEYRYTRFAGIHPTQNSVFDLSSVSQPSSPATRGTFVFLSRDQAIGRATLKSELHTIRIGLTRHFDWGGSH